MTVRPAVILLAPSLFLVGLASPARSQAAISNEYVKVREQVIQKPRSGGPVKFAISIAWLQGYPLDGADVCFRGSKRVRLQLTSEDDVFGSRFCRYLEPAGQHRLVFKGRLRGRSSKPVRLSYQLSADYGVEGTYEIWPSSFKIPVRRR